MFYVKSGEKRIFIKDTNVFTTCCGCGKELQIPLEAAVVDGELNLYGFAYFCKKCAKDKWNKARKEG